MCFEFYSLADLTLLAFGNPLMDNQLGCSHHLLASYRSTCCLNQHEQTEWKHLGLKSYRCTTVQRTSCQDLSIKTLTTTFLTNSFTLRKPCSSTPVHILALQWFSSHQSYSRTLQICGYFLSTTSFSSTSPALNPDCTYTQDLQQWCYIFLFLRQICIWNSLNSHIALKS